MAKRKIDFNDMNKKKHAFIIPVFTVLLFLIGFASYGQQTDSPKNTLNDTALVNRVDTAKQNAFATRDTLSRHHPKVTSFIAPVALIGYGASSFFIHPVRRLDSYVYTEAARNNFITSHHYEDYFQYGPLVLTYGLNLVGVHCKNNFIDRTLIFVLTEGIMGVSVLSLKHITHRLRPDGSDYYSFPSGHTANAFAGAEFMSQELGGRSAAYSVVGYSLAVTTGVFRIYHQDHWLSDVLAGAGFGILSARVAYLVYPYLRNAFAKKEQPKNQFAPEGAIKQKERKSAILLPSYNGGNLGLQFAMQL